MPSTWQERIYRALAIAALAQSRAQFDKAYIRTPISGTVLQLSQQQGETIAAGLSAPTLIIVADLDRLQVNATYQEILDVPVRKVTIPVAAGRNLAVLVEAAVRNFVLNQRGIDSTKEFIERQQKLAPDRPFFMYFSTGATHEPHQVDREWIDKYKGQFDEGWDVCREKIFTRQMELGVVPAHAELPARNPRVSAWNSLSDDQRKLFARFMEAYAGFMEHTDFHIGRLLDFLKVLGEFDNTLIMLVSDNGASSEGGPTGSVNENLFFNNVKEDLATNLAHIDELGAVLGLDLDVLEREAAVGDFSADIIDQAIAFGPGLHTRRGWLPAPASALAFCRAASELLRFLISPLTVAI